MIEVTPTKTIDVECLGAYARHEWEAAGPFAQAAVDFSEKVWLLEDEVPLAYVGILRESLLAIPFFWFFLCKDFRWQYLLEMRPLMRPLKELYPRMETAVWKGFKEGHRFARFGGFRPTERTIDIAGREHQVYETRN